MAQHRHVKPAKTLLSAAARYREWHVNRIWYIMAFMIIVAANLFQTTRVVALSGNTIDTTWFVPRSLESPWMSFLSAALGVMVMWYDRVRGTLENALYGPLPRRQILMAKLWMASATIILGNALVAFVSVIVVMAIKQSAMTWAMHWQLVSTAMPKMLLLTMSRLALLMTAMAMTTLMSSLAFLVIAILIVGYFPELVSSAVAIAAHLLFSNVFPSWISTPITVSGKLSPLNFLWPGHPMIYVVVYLLWAWGLSRMALIWWRQVPVERLFEPFYFLFLWNFFYAFLAVLTALWGVVLLVPNFDLRMHTIVFVLLAVVGWFVWRWLVITIGRISWRFGYF